MASGILLSLTNCYDKQSGKFDVGQGFVFEALCNVERMLSQAGDALHVLFENHDLRSFDEIEKAELEAEAATVSAGFKTDTTDGAPVDNPNLSEANNLKSGVATISDQRLMDELSSEIGADFGPPMRIIDYLQSSESAARLSERLDAILERFPREEPFKKIMEPADKASKTYEEFLDKLTAMADAAASEAIRAGKKELTLAPVLESLRDDVRRLRAVA